jgi:hypothetical protein
MPREKPKRSESLSRADKANQQLAAIGIALRDAHAPR